MPNPLVSEKLWSMIEPLLPKKKNRHRKSAGRLPVDDRKALTGILFVLKTGIPWESLPQEMGCGSGMTCWRRLRDWQNQNVWDKLFRKLLDGLQGADKINWKRAIVDSSSIKAPGGGEKTEPNPTDRRKLRSKHHLIVDGKGIPLAIRLTKANRHNVTQLEKLLADIPYVKGKKGHPRHRPKTVIGDKVYDSKKERKKLKKNGNQTAASQKKHAAW